MGEIRPDGMGVQYIVRSRVEGLETTMTNRTRSKRTAITWLAVPALLIACADEPAVELDGPHQLPVEFTEEFHIGDQPSERLFVDITSMAFDPDGRLVVLDRDEFAVTMFDVDGTEVARWGNKGEGPGEFENPPSALAVSDDARVAVRSFRRVDVLTLAGEPIGSHLLDTLNLREIAFDGEGRVVAWAVAPETRDGRREHIVRLDDREVLWSAPLLPPRVDFEIAPPHLEFAALGNGRIAAGLSDEYDLAILDASTGREMGRITRDVSLRTPSESYLDELREELRGGFEGEALDPLIAAALEQMPHAEKFPVIIGAFAGPPGGRTVWIRRGKGVGDPLAPPPQAGDGWKFLLHDLFDGDSYEYLGTVEIPDNITLMAGDATRVAGRHRDELGVHSVRVLRVAIDGR